MYEFKDKYNIDDLREIMTILRSDHGCMWDREQDHKSIRMDVLEEAYEVMEAIDSENSELLREELGDLLLQVIFHSELEREKSVFNFDDVCDGICKKLIYRHPHVFGEVKVGSTEDVLKNWDKLKSKSKGEEKPSERLESVPKLLPALMRGEKVGKRAAHVGMDFASTKDVIASLRSEIDELENALDGQKNDEIEAEFGDILFSCCNLGRFIEKDAEKALTFSINKFIMRFREVERLAEEQGNSMEKMSAEELDVLWKRVKAEN